MRGVSQLTYMPGFVLSAEFLLGVGRQPAQSDIAQVGAPSGAPGTWETGGGLLVVEARSALPGTPRGMGGIAARTAIMKPLASTAGSAERSYVSVGDVRLAFACPGCFA